MVCISLTTISLKTHTKLLEFYINDVKRGLVDGNAHPEILKESPATAWVDGKRGLGAIVGNFCMDLAIKKAKAVGVGWVVAKGRKVL